MDLVDSTKQKLVAVMERIAGLRSGDFPHRHSKEALDAIESIFIGHQTTIGSLTSASDPSTVYNYCNVVVKSLYDYLPLLGFLHRSKNPSNAFELYGPLLRLAQKLVNQDAKLIFSSEWEFSPFTLVGVPHLRGFIWLGLPASESSNALLTPLAGHEFGHSVWQGAKLEDEYQTAIDTAIVDSIKANWTVYSQHFPEVPDQTALVNDLFGTRTWRPAHECALSQAEELFCDLLGLRVFGTAYLHAFAYLLAPGDSQRQSANYPSLPDRVQHMTRAAAVYGTTIPSGYQDLFQTLAPSTPALASKSAFLLSLADGALSAVAGTLTNRVNEIATRSGIPTIDQAEVDTIGSAFAQLVPYDSATSVAAVINAGWQTSNEPALWVEYRKVLPRKREVLNQLILKTVQVLEFRSLLAVPP